MRRRECASVGARSLYGHRPSRQQRQPWCDALLRADPAWQVARHAECRYTGRMQRPITGFRQDEEGHWVALLGCGHPQHVRHHPPMASRPWVLTEEGRSARLGQMLDCLRCERFELPPDFVAYRSTPEFTEATVPAALRRDHSTRAGVWGVIRVQAGRLRYRVPCWSVEQVLTPEVPGIVVPEVLHSVEPLGAVRFRVEFHAAPAAVPPR